MYGWASYHASGRESGRDRDDAGDEHEQDRPQRVRASQGPRRGPDRDEYLTLVLAVLGRQREPDGEVTASMGEQLPQLGAVLGRDGEVVVDYVELVGRTDLDEGA